MNIRQNRTNTMPAPTTSTLLGRREEIGKKTNQPAMGLSRHQLRVSGKHGQLRPTISLLE